MRYISTRGRAPEINFKDVLLAGMATDGGLYVPQEWPLVSPPSTGNYAHRAATLMQPFVGDEIDQSTFERLCSEAYSSFGDDAVAPLVQLSTDHYLLELFHGPTLAFKDIALQLIGKLFDHVLSESNQRVMVVGATSGDTGSAAIEGVRGCSNVDIVILYPSGRVSEVQRRQMTTIDAPNAHAVAIDGTFDDCQDLVKAMFNDAPFREVNNLSAVNSINWVRIMAQTVYYFTALQTLNRPASFSVPTGNFGNVLAGWIAKQMGAPIEKLIVGSNTNDILARFIDSHSMHMSAVVPTLSPSMDIQVSSNFERLLFEINDRNGAATAHQLANFRVTGALSVSDQQFDRWIARDFQSHRVDDAETLATMARVYKDHGVQIDPHTAVGVASAEHCRERGVPVVTLATAHPAKFPDAVELATGVRPQLPQHLRNLLDLPERVTNLPNDLLAVEQFVASCR